MAAAVQNLRQLARRRQACVQRHTRRPCADMRALRVRSKDQMKNFGGETPYSVMFGPDICGFSTQKVRSVNNRSLRWLGGYVAPDMCLCTYRGRALT